MHQGVRETVTVILSCELSFHKVEVPSCKIGFATVRYLLLLFLLLISGVLLTRIWFCHPLFTIFNLDYGFWFTNFTASVKF